MEKWIEIRRRVLNGELSKRAVCVAYDIHWETLKEDDGPQRAIGVGQDESSPFEARPHVVYVSEHPRFPQQSDSDRFGQTEHLSHRPQMIIWAIRFPPGTNPR